MDELAGKEVVATEAKTLTELVEAVRVQAFAQGAEQNGLILNAEISGSIEGMLRPILKTLLTFRRRRRRGWSGGACRQVHCATRSLVSGCC
jgi:hypothetical protein